MTDSTEKPASRLARRSLVLRLGGVAVLPVPLSACIVEAPRQQVAPAPRRATGITDNDPSDGPGNGRGRQAPVRRTTGITDSDPNDGPGNGRGRQAPVRRATGLTDSDPNDGPGNGRSGR